ncbi:MAG TPA: MFS transporter [Candidatus Limnocylindrales bacterium]
MRSRLSRTFARQSPLSRRPNGRLPGNRPGGGPLGRDFRRLWLAATVSNVGDGITVVATPLLVAALTADPALVAGAAFVTQLPWLLFALISGAFADRWDRRRTIVVVNVLRGVILAAVAAAVATGMITVALLYLAGFLLGSLETLVDSATEAILPAIVADRQLERANAWLMIPFVVGNQMAAKPLGAYLFVLGAAIPFGVDALSFLVAAMLLTSIRPRGGGVPSPHQSRPGLRLEVAEGLRGLWSRSVLRTMALCLCLGNVLFCAAFASFVLYAQQRLGLSEVGFGTILSIWAGGGLVGTLLAPRLHARFGSGTLLRAGLIIEVGTHAVLAVTRAPAVAAAILVLFGVHTMVWGVLIQSLRQRLVPDHLRGRVGSVFSLLNLGGAAIGTLAGGILAKATDLTTPFWFAAAGMAALTIAVWPRFSNEALTVQP